MPRLISADVIDDSTGDWTISDEGAGSGAQRGPIHTWPAPALRHDDRNPLLPFKSNPLNSRGQLDAYDFLRVKVDHPVNSFGDDIEAPHDTRGFESYEERIDASLLVDGVRGMRDPTYGDFDAFEAGDVNNPTPTRSDVRSPTSTRSEVRSPTSTRANTRGNFTATITGGAGAGNTRVSINMPYGGPRMTEPDDAGMLLNPSDFQTFIRRTDAGALDNCCVDAGNIYDDIGSNYHSIENLMVKWGAKLTPQQKTKLLNAAKHAQQFAKSPSGRWPSFETYKKHILEVRREALGSNPKQDAEIERDHFKWLAGRYPAGGIGGAISGAVSSVGSGIASVGKGAFAIAKGVATPVAGLITSPYKLASDIASGKNVLASIKDTVTRDIKNVKGVAPYVQAVISFVPGVGAGVNAAIAAGAALANGQPITSALVAGLKNALPGGPIAGQAFETAYKVARGDNVGEAALAMAREQIPGGEIAKKAFDAGLAVAKGQNLQQAAVGVLKGAAVSLVPGNNAIIKDAVSDIAAGKNVAQTALKAGTSAMASFSPLATGPFSDVGPRMLATVSTQNLAKLLPSDVQKAASAILNNASLRSLSVNEIAAKLNVPNHIAREGLASVTQSVLRSGGAAVPHLAPAKELASQIPMTMSFDQAIAKFASKMSPIAFSHNARRPMGPGTRYAAMNIAKMKNPYIVPVYAQQSREMSLSRANAINPWARPSFSANGYGAGALDPTTLPVLKQGSSGPFVTQWQNILKTSADGKFGPQTASLTRVFQAQKGLTADGIVGPNTWKAGLASIMVPTAPGLPPISVPGLPPVVSAPIANAMPTIRQGSTGTAVKTWQAIVGVPADGQFGPQTATATRSWQSKNGLVADGIVGPQTWTKALAGGATTIPLPPPPTSLPPMGIPTGPISIPVPGGATTIPLPPPPTSLPPMGIPTGPISIPVPGGAPIVLPPFSVPPVITTTTPIPGGPVITTSTPTGGGPIVVSQPPITEPPATPTKAAGAGVAIAVGLGLLYFVAKGSSGKIL